MEEWDTADDLDLLTEIRYEIRRAWASRAPPATAGSRATHGDGRRHRRGHHPSARSSRVDAGPHPSEGRTQEKQLRPPVGRRSRRSHGEKGGVAADEGQHAGPSVAVEDLLCLGRLRSPLSGNMDDQREDEFCACFGAGWKKVDVIFFGINKCT